MDFSTFDPSSWLIFLIPPLIYLIFKQIKIKGQNQNLPPSPFQWPLIGNIPNVLGKNPHVIVTQIAQKLGPLMSLKFGNQIVVIGSSPESAAEILKTHDRVLSARYSPKATPIKVSDLKQYSLLWSPECNSHWRSIRVLWRTELFSNKAMESLAAMREKKVSEMVEILSFKQGEVVKIGDFVFSTVFNILGNICFSRDMINLEDESVGSDMKENIWRFMESGTTPILADLFPIFDGIIDLQGQKKKSKKCLENLFKVWEGIIKGRREEHHHHCIESDAKKHGDFLDFMLANEYSDAQINYMLLEIFPAGTGTLTSTIEWAMAELLKNKSAMKRLYSELQTEINSNPIKESAIFQLPYLNACIKEALRLHPPIAFLPHCASETCQVMNYTIPKNSLVFVNLWAIGHDPNLWEDPFLFKPERFLNSNLDFKGQDFEFLPFGAGRRMCPGLPFASKQVHLILASLVYHFEWSLPNNGDTSMLDMDEKYAVPLQRKRPLLLVPTRK